MKTLKYLILVVALFFALPSEAQVVHRWQAELSEACESFLTTEHTPEEFLAVIIHEARDYYIWRPGWEKPVNRPVLGIFVDYNPRLANASRVEIDQAAVEYRQYVYRMYQEKLRKHPNPYAKFTQADIQRIKNARI